MRRHFSFASSVSRQTLSNGNFILSSILFFPSRQFPTICTMNSRSSRTSCATCNRYWSPSPIRCARRKFKSKNNISLQPKSWRNATEITRHYIFAAALLLTFIAFHRKCTVKSLKWMRTACSHGENGRNRSCKINCAILSLYFHQ